MSCARAPINSALTPRGHRARLGSTLPPPGVAHGAPGAAPCETVAETPAPE